MEYLILLCTGKHFQEKLSEEDEFDFGLLLNKLKEDYFDNCKENPNFLLLSSEAKHAKICSRLLQKKVKTNWKVEHPDILNLVDTTPQDIESLADLVSCQDDNYTIITVIGQLEMMRYFARKFEANPDGRLWQSLKVCGMAVCIKNSKHKLQTEFVVSKSI
jgi:hypothetical protein